MHLIRKRILKMKYRLRDLIRNLALSSIKRLKEVVMKEKPIVFFGHDIEQEKGCKVFPEYI